MTDPREDLAQARSDLDGLDGLSDQERVAALEAIAATLESALSRDAD